MAMLRPFNIPNIDYQRQTEAFIDFLRHFKSSQSRSEDTAADAIEDLHLDGDGTSDEYDFMDDVDNGNGRERRRRGADKEKYMTILQEIADREKSNVVVELDDLDLVRHLHLSLADIRHRNHKMLIEISNSVRKISG